MVKEILVKVAENVLVTLQVFFGKREEKETQLLKVGEQVYRFVEGTEENVVISSKGTVLRRYPKSHKYGGRKDYYQVVPCRANNSGYLQVGLNKTSGLVHRLVAEAFLEKPENKTEVDHINRDKQDNQVGNLRWVTREENMKNGCPFRIKPEDKNHWTSIVAVSKFTGEIITFPSSSDIVPFAKSKKWGKGWGPRLYEVLEKQGYAYGFYWSGTCYKGNEKN